MWKKLMKNKIGKWAQASMLQQQQAQIQIQN